MIKIEKVDVIGWEHAIRGMRNPKNSWDESDSCFITHLCKENFDCGQCEEIILCRHDTDMGEKDLRLMQTLADAGTDHGKYMRMIVVYADVTAPLYWWKEADTYRMGVEKNSCSTMHKIHAKEFTFDDFSTEHFYDRTKEPNGFIPGHLGKNSADMLNDIIKYLNWMRERYIATKDKTYWWQMIQLLPSSYNQKRTVMMSYAALRNIYHARRNHKLDEWRSFCKWIETLPYSELITGGKK